MIEPITAFGHPIDIISFAIGAVLTICIWTAIMVVFPPKPYRLESNLVQMIEKWDGYIRDLHKDFDSLYRFAQIELNKMEGGKQ
jgi:hypothetical protein